MYILLTTEFALTSISIFSMQIYSSKVDLYVLLYSSLKFLAIFSVVIIHDFSMYIIFNYNEREAIT